MAGVVSGNDTLRETGGLGGIGRPQQEGITNRLDLLRVVSGQQRANGLTELAGLVRRVLVPVRLRQRCVTGEIGKQERVGFGVFAHHAKCSKGIYPKDAALEGGHRPVVSLGCPLESLAPVAQVPGELRDPPGFATDGRRTRGRVLWAAWLREASLADAD
jgi:hypothetical protein